MRLRRCYTSGFPPSNVVYTLLGSPVRRTSPSPSAKPPVVITHTGVVEVHDASSGAILGYISTDFSYGARYTPILANALAVSFQTDGSGSGSKLDISISVCPGTVSALGSSHPTTLEFEPELAPFRSR